MPKIYTKTGDSGETGLGNGARVLKCDARVEALGALDELNALLGVVASEFASERAQNSQANFRNTILGIQRDIFLLGATLSNFPLSKKISLSAKTRALEKRIDILEQSLPALTRFILPGGSYSGALLHYARTVARRAERAVVALQEQSVRVSKGLVQVSNLNQQLRKQTNITAAIKYLNRLSDFLFVLARSANASEHAKEEIWKM